MNKFKKMQIKTSSLKETIDLFAGLSKQRLELLWAIKTHKPESIYWLAQCLQKSQPYIQKEIKFLSEKGLLSLKKVKSNGRTRLKPEMNYQILTLEVDFIKA